MPTPIKILILISFAASIGFAVWLQLRERRRWVEAGGLLWDLSALNPAESADMRQKVAGAAGIILESMGTHQGLRKLPIRIRVRPTDQTPYPGVAATAQKERLWPWSGRTWVIDTIYLNSRTGDRWSDLIAHEIWAHLAYISVGLGDNYSHAQETYLAPQTVLRMRLRAL